MRKTQRKRVKAARPKLRRVPSRSAASVVPSDGDIGRRDYETLFEFSPAMYVLLDATGIVRHINRAGCRMLGVEERRVIGFPLRLSVSPSGRSAFLEHFRKARATDEIIETDLTFNPRGELPPVDVRLYTRRSFHGGRRMFPTVAIDMGEHHALERARQSAVRDRDQAEHDRELAQAADAAKDHLIAVVSHELRNPLSPAMAAADGLFHTVGMPPGTRELASVIKRNIELEARLIDDLLDFARINRGRLDLRLKTVDIHEVLRESIRACELEARRRNVTLVSDWQAYHHHAQADEGRLRQVFWNLLNNAVKFSHPGGSITVRTSSDDAAWCRVTIRDRGVGMDKSRLSVLFRPFADAPLPGEHRRGLGLGLTISFGIVESLGGRLWAASEGRGQGATFTIELPTVARPTSESDPPQDRTADLVGIESAVQHVKSR